MALFILFWGALQFLTFCVNYPDSKGTLAQRQIMVGMVGQRRRWAIYVGPTLGQPGIAMRNIRLWLV